MSDLNCCIFTGRLGADPEIRAMQDGRKVASFRIAVGQSWRDKNTGERKEKATWVPVVIFAEGLVKVCEQYLRKGSRVAIQGQMQVRQYEKDGITRYVSEIVLQGFNSTLTMLDSRNDGEGQQGSAPAPSGMDEDTIPFAPEVRV